MAEHLGEVYVGVADDGYLMLHEDDYGVIRCPEAIREIPQVAWRWLWEEVIVDTIRKGTPPISLKDLSQLATTS